MDAFLDILTLKGAGRQTIDNSSTFGVPLKFVRYNGSWAMWKVGGIKFHEIFFFFVKRSLIPEYHEREFFWRQYPRNPYALTVQNMYAKGVSRTSLSALSTNKSKSTNRHK